MKFACKRYFSSISNENDSSSSFFTKSAFKCTSEADKAHLERIRTTGTYESAKYVPRNTRKCAHNGFVSDLLK